MLLSNGASIDISDRRHRTPLALFGFLFSFSKPTKKKSINQKFSEPLELKMKNRACFRGNKDAVKTLLNSGADPLITDDQFLFFFFFLFLFCFLFFFLSFPYQVWTFIELDYSGRTPLMLATMISDKQVPFILPSLLLFSFSHILLFFFRDHFVNLRNRVMILLGVL